MGTKSKVTLWKALSEILPTQTRLVFCALPWQWLPCKGLDFRSDYRKRR